MECTVGIWKTETSGCPEIWERVEADDPLEAAFVVMRQCGLRSAFFVMSSSADELKIGEYTDIVCPGWEVC